MKYQTYNHGDYSNGMLKAFDHVMAFCEKMAARLDENIDKHEEGSLPKVSMKSKRSTFLQILNECKIRKGKCLERNHPEEVIVEISELPVEPKGKQSIPEKLVEMCERENKCNARIAEIDKKMAWLKDQKRKTADAVSKNMKHREVLLQRFKETSSTVNPLQLND